jgi:hypothetical protein
MVGKAPSPHSRLNGAKSTPNRNPTYSHLHNQPGQTRGYAQYARYRDLFQYALDRGNINQMTETPSIDFLRECVANVDLRLELRITAASYAARYEARPLAARPWAPDLKDSDYAMTSRPPPVA